MTVWQTISKHKEYTIFEMRIGINCPHMFFCKVLKRISLNCITFQKGNVKLSCCKKHFIHLKFCIVVKRRWKNANAFVIFFNMLRIILLQIKFARRKFDKKCSINSFRLQKFPMKTFQKENK